MAKAAIGNRQQAANSCEPPRSLLQMLSSHGLLFVFNFQEKTKQLLLDALRF